jgi:small-conductance mechanosensitive channel
MFTLRLLLCCLSIASAPMASEVQAAAPLPTRQDPDDPVQALKDAIARKQEELRTAIDIRRRLDLQKEIGELERQLALAPTLVKLKAQQVAIKAKEEQLAEKQAEARDEVDPQQKSQLQAQVRKLQDELIALRREFDDLAIGVESAEDDKEFNLQDEVMTLLQPIIEELKAATEGPRQLLEDEKKRSRLAQQREAYENSIDRLARLRDVASDPALKEALAAALAKNRAELAATANEWEIVNTEIEQRKKERVSLIDSVTQVIGSFFRERGQNVAWAVGAFLLVFLGGRFLFRRIQAFSPMHRQPNRSFYVRLIDVGVHVLITATAIATVLIVLYVRDDYVLLGVALIFLLGVAWAGKTAIPQYMEQIRVLLNLGSVRERERIVIAGLPWRVEQLKFYTRLVNPELSGGTLRLPIRDLIGLHSRPCSDKEIWFPCREQDWVLLSDGTRGKVVTQTPEMVQLVLLGGSHVTYQTSAFLGMNPQNLSTNFRLAVTFGIDYMHQAICTTDVPTIMRERLRTELEAAVGDALHNVNVEFKEAGASSLDYEVLADFKGTVASKHAMLRRAIQRILVDACNEHGWVIPFQQITLHQAAPA